MSYLKFERQLMTNIGESLQREFIRTNRKGAYCSSSIIDCNTRKYHGILVVPIPEISPNNHVLLSSLDLTIIQHNASFNVGVHEYEGNVFSPKGYKYIRDYNLDIGHSTIYRVGGVVLKKEMFFCHYEHKVIIKFTLLEANSRTTLQLRPMLAFRDVKMLTHKNNNINKEVREVHNGKIFRLYDGYPDLYIQFSKENTFVNNDYWNENIVYLKEKERGYNYTEDLYVPGYFEMDIAKGEEIYFSASLEEADVNLLAKEFNAERDIRIPKDSFKNCLLNAAQQFYYRPNDKDGYILAGYPWFSVRARDLMIALPGCSFFAGAPERFERVMDTFIPALDDYITQKGVNRTIQQLSDPDVGLWAVWAIQQYFLWNNNQNITNKYSSFIYRIIEYYIKNIHPNTRVDDIGLLYTTGSGKPLTWMDAQINGHAVVRREGHIVEMNALWYNVLCFLREISPDKVDDNIEVIIRKIEENYTRIFLNEHGYLFDYVKYNEPKDWSVRPNMIFAASLPYSPLNTRQKHGVVDIVTRELLSPKGLRTLSPKSEGYRGSCNGTHIERELSYYNGSAWPWLLGQYFEAYLKIHGKGAISFVERILIGIQEEVQEHGIGTLSELFDGNPPFKGRGAISFAMNVGEIIRALHLLEQEKAKHENINPIIRYY